MSTKIGKWEEEQILYLERFVIHEWVHLMITSHIALLNYLIFKFNSFVSHFSSNAIFGGENKYKNTTKLSVLFIINQIKITDKLCEESSF